MDLRYGIVHVLGSMKRIVSGLNIGSPTSAGAAILQASKKEFDATQHLSPEDLALFLTHVLAQRWADDLLYAYRLSTYLYFRATLDRLQDEKFYGDNLLSVPVEDAEAFGFRLSWRHNALALRNKMALIKSPEDLPPEGWMQTTLGFHGGQQFYHHPTLAGVIKGHLMRPWVSAGVPESEQKMAVARVAMELQVLNLPENVISRMVRRLSREFNSDLKPIGNMLEWTPEERKRWVTFYDERELFWRKLEICDVRVATFYHQ